MNPYAYVGGNPETKNDPTGNVVLCPDPTGCWGPPPGPNPPPTGCHGVNHPWCNPNPPPPGCTSGCKKSGPPTTGGNNTGCNKQCNTDKQLILSYLYQQQAQAQARTQFFADALSFLGDIGAAIGDIMGQAWLGLAIDILSGLTHLAAVAADLRVFGINIISPEWAAIIGTLKGVVNFIDVAKSVFDFVSPGKYLKNVFEWVVERLAPQANPAQMIVGIADLVAGGSGALGSVINGVENSSYFTPQINAVAGYNNQTAHDVCVQDWGNSVNC